MRKLRKKAAILLIFAMVTIFGMTVLASEDVAVPEESEEMLIAGASESDLSDYDEALGYVEAYDENVVSDADFDRNLATALTTVRGDSSSAILS